MTKVNVNGKDTHPIFTWLKKAFPGDIGWNFTGVWVIGPDGVPTCRFNKAPFKEIEKCMAQSMVAKKN